MQELAMDAATWKGEGDFYTSLFNVVRAPVWHGRNFNTLRDSIGTGQINEIDVPYRLVFRNYSQVDPAARQIAKDFVDLINELAAKGVPVEIRIEN